MDTIKKISDWLDSPITLDDATGHRMVMKSYDPDLNEGLFEVRALDMGHKIVLWVRTKGRRDLGVGADVRIEVSEEEQRVECHSRPSKTGRVNLQPIMSIVANFDILFRPVEAWMLTRRIEELGQEPAQKTLF